MYVNLAELLKVLRVRSVLFLLGVFFLLNFSSEKPKGEEGR